MKNVKVLFLVTSHNRAGASDARIGVWLEELATPYYIFRDAGAVVTVASPYGGEVPLEARSQSIIVATSSTKRFLKDPEAMDILSNSIPVEEIKAADFDLVFLPGGHGSMWDIAGNVIKKLLEEFNTACKPIAAISHGVTALLSLQNDQGQVLIKGKQLTAFSNSEEKTAGLTTVLPFSLETELTSLGALYSKGPDYVSHVVIDDNIITGQNPASSEEVAKKVKTWLLNKHQEEMAAV